MGRGSSTGKALRVALLACSSQVSVVELVVPVHTAADGSSQVSELVGIAGNARRSITAGEAGLRTF